MGQLIFDYFTALPLSPENPCDGTTQWPQGNPPVDQAGVRVAGRININAAPYSVLAGLPIVPMGDPATAQVGLWALPADYRTKIEAAIYSHSDNAYRYWGNSQITQSADNLPTDIGSEAAFGIVAYRDARQLSVSEGEIPQQAKGDRALSRPNGEQRHDPLTFRRGHGCGRWGEALNASPTHDQEYLWKYNMDTGVVARRNRTPGAGRRGTAQARLRRGRGTDGVAR